MSSSSPSVSSAGSMPDGVAPYAEVSDSDDETLVQAASAAVFTEVIPSDSEESGSDDEAAEIEVGEIEVVPGSARADATGSGNRSASTSSGYETSDHEQYVPAEGYSEDQAATDITCVFRGILSRAGRFLMCYLCGCPVITDSLSQHHRECLRKFVALNATIPAYLRIPPPVKPKVPVPSAECAQKKFVEYNLAASRVFLTSAQIKCPSCKVPVALPQVTRHVNSCGKANP